MLFHLSIPQIVYIPQYQICVSCFPCYIREYYYHQDFFFPLPRLSSQKTGNYPSLVPFLSPHPSSVTFSFPFCVWGSWGILTTSLHPHAFGPPHFTRLDSSPPGSLSSILFLTSPNQTYLKNRVVIDGSPQSAPKPYPPALSGPFF